MPNDWSYILLPFAATALSLLIFAKAYRSGAGYPYLKLFATLVVGNTCQVGIYLFLDLSFTAGRIFTDLYLITAYFFFAHLLQLALSMSERERGSWIKYITIAPVILTVLHLAGLMVDSYRISETGEILHNDGQLSVLFDAFVLLSAVATIGTFAVNIKTIQKDFVLASRNFIALLSFVPFILAAVYLIMRSNTDNPVSVVYIIPVMTSWIVCIFYYITRNTIIDLALSPQGHLERLRLTYLCMCHIGEPEIYRHFEEQQRLHFYKENLRRHQYHYQNTALTTGVGVSTIRNFLKKHDPKFYLSTLKMKP